MLQGFQSCQGSQRLQRPAHKRVSKKQARQFLQTLEGLKRACQAEVLSHAVRNWGPEYCCLWLRSRGNVRE